MNELKERIHENGIDYIPGTKPRKTPRVFPRTGRGARRKAKAEATATEAQNPY